MFQKAEGLQDPSSLSIPNCTVSGANFTKEKPDIPLLTVLVARGARSGRKGGTSHPCGELRLACHILRIFLFNTFQPCQKTDHAYLHIIISWPIHRICSAFMPSAKLLSTRLPNQPLSPGPRQRRHATHNARRCQGHGHLTVFWETVAVGSSANSYRP